MARRVLAYILISTAEIFLPRNPEARRWPYPVLHLTILTRIDGGFVDGLIA